VVPIQRSPIQVAQEVEFCSLRGRRSLTRNKIGYGLLPPAEQRGLIACGQEAGPENIEPARRVRLSI